MSYGTETINGEQVSWGYSDIKDWFLSVVLSFPAPWSVAALNGKYYGTVITDARGIAILNFWESEGEPSEREKARFQDWTPETWAEYCCDSHWESDTCLTIANEVVRIRNANKHNRTYQENELLKLIVSFGSWNDDIWKDIQCGGPGKRAIEPSNADTRRSLGYV